MFDVNRDPGEIETESKEKQRLLTFWNCHFVIHLAKKASLTIFWCAPFGYLYFCFFSVVIVSCFEPTTSWSWAVRLNHFTSTAQPSARGPFLCPPRLIQMPVLTFVRGKNNLKEYWVTIKIVFISNSHVLTSQLQFYTRFFVSRV